MNVFENYWPGARAARMRRWEADRDRMLWAWPASSFWKTMLKAWCEVTFGGGVRRSIAPSREREFDEMCVDVGLVPNWRLMWDAWVPRGKGYVEAGTWALAWSTDQGERSRRVRTLAKLFRCFRVWSASTREAGQRMAAYGYVCGSEGEDGAPPPQLLLVRESGGHQGDGGRYRRFEQASTELAFLLHAIEDI